MDDVTQDGGKNVFSQASDQQYHIFHLNNLTAYKEHNAKRHIPEGQREEYNKQCLCIVGLSQRKKISADPVKFINFIYSLYEFNWIKDLHLPHDPGHQYHSGFIEGIEKTNELFSFCSKLF